MDRNYLPGFAPRLLTALLALGLYCMAANYLLAANGDDVDAQYLYADM